MGKQRKTTNNYNKDYFTARGIPQPGAEEVPEDEKQKLREQELAEPHRDPDPTGPGDDPAIARQMGRTREGERDG